MLRFPGASRRSLYELLFTLWLIGGGVRALGAASLHEGFIDLRPLSRALRCMVVLGLALVLVFLASILASEFLREQGGLEALTLESGPSRGILAPSLAIPLTLGAVTLGWAYILTGALHVRRRVRWLVLLAMGLFALSELVTTTLSSAVATAITQPVDTAAASCLFLAALGLLICAFFLLPRAGLPIELEFCLVLALVAGLMLPSMLLAIWAQQGSAIPFLSSYLVTGLVTSNRVLLIPFLLIAGTEMVNFGVEASGWLARAVHRHAAGWMVALFLALFLAYRLLALGFSLLPPGPPARQWYAWAGGALLAAGIGAILWWRSQKPAGGATPQRVVVGLIVGLALFQLLLIPLVALLSFLFALLSPFTQAALGWQNQTLGGVLEASNRYRELYLLLVALAGAGLAVWAARRSRWTAAAFGMALGWSQALRWLAEDGRPMERLRFEYADVDAVLLLALAALTVYWLARRELTHERALRLLALALFGALLNQTHFLDNPLSPLFAFAGVLFLALSILWNVLTVGGRFANRGSAAFPRASRLLMYFGYVMLSVTVAHWFIVTHNVQEQSFQSGLVLNGLTIYGLALAYVVVAERGEALLREEAE